jgi:ankyrin repeat protein
VGTVQRLSEQHPSAIHDKDDHGFTPLYHACLFGHTEVIQVLLERGADASAMDLGGLTVLTIACEKGHAAVVDLLLRSGGGDPTHRDSIGRTPRDWAKAKGHDAVLRVLDRWKSDDDFVTHSGDGGGGEGEGGALASGSTNDVSTSPASGEPPPSPEAALSEAAQEAETEPVPLAGSPSHVRSVGLRVEFAQLAATLGAGAALADPTRSM